MIPFGDSTQKAYVIIDAISMKAEVKFYNDQQISDFLATYCSDEDDESLTVRREFRYDKHKDLGFVPDSILVSDGYPRPCVCGRVISAYVEHHVTADGHAYCSQRCLQCMEMLNSKFAQVIHAFVDDNPGLCFDTSMIYTDKKKQILKFSFPGSKHDNIITGKMGTKYLNSEIVLHEKDLASWEEYQSNFETF